jgi:hypothetical protein
MMAPPSQELEPPAIPARFILALAEVEKRLRVADRLARCIDDPRCPDQIVHSLADMIGFRMKMIAAGYEDGNDATLRQAQAVALRSGLQDGPRMRCLWVGIWPPGLRPGEKLFEELFDPSEVQDLRTEDGYVIASPRVIDKLLLDKSITELQNAVVREDRGRALELLLHIVPEYRSAKAMLEQAARAVERDLDDAAPYSQAHPGHGGCRNSAILPSDDRCLN